MHAVRSPALILAALLAPSLVVGISCSLAGLTGAPQASSSSSGGSGGSDAGVDGGGEDADGGTDANLVLYEAEDALVFGGYVSGSNADASAGKYVVVPADAGTCNNDDYVVFDVTASADGTYLIVVRYWGTGLHNDTFFIQVDMGPNYEVRAGELFWWWEGAVADVNSDAGTPIQYQWEAGVHQIIISCRAPDVLLDRLRLQQISP
jgi:hypothetical protein